MAKAKAKKAAHGRRRRRSTARSTAWCLRPMTLGLLTWISTIGTVTPLATVSVTWLANQYQQYESNRIIAAYESAFAPSLAKDEAWLVSHPIPAAEEAPK